MFCLLMSEDVGTEEEYPEYVRYGAGRWKGQTRDADEESVISGSSIASTSSRTSSSSGGSTASSGSSSSSTSTGPHRSDRYKTEKCRQFYETGRCQYGHHCMFAHGVHEMKRDGTRPRNYKTRLCNTYQFQGFCTFGSRCAFIHCHPDPLKMIETAVAAGPRLPMPENLSRVLPEFYPQDILTRKADRDLARDEELLPSRFIAEHWPRLPVFQRLSMR